MRFVQGLVLSATDLANHLACRHLTFLNLAAASGRLKPPIFHDDRLEALRQRGFQHESAYLDHLRSQGREVLELRDLGLGSKAVEQTLAAMRAGSEVIAQATLASGYWHGRADVLMKVDRPSDLGGWSYEVIDTKLSGETRAGTLLQLCLYSDLLGEVLPEPSAGDIFFDFEGDSFVGERGREYLFGYVTVDRGPPRYHSLWALTEREERVAFEQFVDEMIDRLDRFPEFHIYHYSPYEPATLKRLMGHFATREDEVDRLLRGERFVDLLAVVRRGLRASVESYSIKELEVFYSFERPLELQVANRLRFALQHALELGQLDQISPEMREAVEGYNRDDCVSTLRLRDWLESLREEHAARGFAVSRPELSVGEPSEELSEDRQRVRQLMDQLLTGVPPEREKRSRLEQAVWLLAQMLEWHRREDKSVWWEYFRLRDLTEEEMLDERSAIAGLHFFERVKTVKRSVIDLYTYPPQEVGIQRGDKLKTLLLDGGDFGTVEKMDPTLYLIRIKKGPSRADLHPQTVFAHNRYDARAQKDSLFRFGTWVAENGIDSEGGWRASRDLLLRRSPRGQVKDGEPLRRKDKSALESARRLVLELVGGVLPIQGPPGSGKTYTGARMICEAVRAGRKVGVTAVSHKVIRNLLEESCRAGQEEGLTLNCLQKVQKKRDLGHDGIVEVTTNQGVVEAVELGEVSVFAGTAWLWARPELAQSLDILFVDEAGQMSLAEVSLRLPLRPETWCCWGTHSSCSNPSKRVIPKGRKCRRSSMF